MGQTTEFFVDPSSDLVRYYQFISRMPVAIEWSLDRDALAVRLVSDPNSGESQMYRERQRAIMRTNPERIKQGKRPKAASRIWTRKDKERVSVLRTDGPEFHVDSRTTRLLRRHNDRALHLFRAALADATNNGIVKVIGEILANSLKEFTKLWDIAHEVNLGSLQIDVLKKQNRVLADEFIKLLPFLPKPKQIGDSSPLAEEVIRHHKRQIYLIWKNGMEAGDSTDTRLAKCKEHLEAIGEQATVKKAQDIHRAEKKRKENN